MMKIALLVNKLGHLYANNCFILLIKRSSLKLSDLVRLDLMRLQFYSRRSVESQV